MRRGGVSTLLEIQRLGLCVQAASPHCGDYMVSTLLEIQLGRIHPELRDVAVRLLFQPFLRFNRESRGGRQKPR